MPKSKMIALRVEPDVLKDFRRRAKHQRKTLATWARDLLLADARPAVVLREVLNKLEPGKIQVGQNEPTLKIWPEPQPGVTYSEGEPGCYAIDTNLQRAVEELGGVPDEGLDESEDLPIVDEETEGW